MSNLMHSKPRVEIAYPFPYFDGSTVEIGMNKQFHPSLINICDYLSMFMVLSGYLLCIVVTFVSVILWHCRIPDSKVANMESTWVLSAPDGLHIGTMKLAIRDRMVSQVSVK